MTITPRMEAVLEILTECAERGEPCPRNQDIAIALGANAKQNISLLISKLEQQGAISVERETWDRVVTITATGKSTAAVPRPQFEIKQDRHYAVSAAKVEAERRTIVVSRDPCFLCGVRGDIGCSHQPAAIPVTLADAGRAYL